MEMPTRCSRSLVPTAGRERERRARVLQEQQSANPFSFPFDEGDEEPRTSSSLHPSTLSFNCYRRLHRKYSPGLRLQDETKATARPHRPLPPPHRHAPRPVLPCGRERVERVPSPEATQGEGARGRVWAAVWVRSKFMWLTYGRERTDVVVYDAFSFLFFSFRVCLGSATHPWC